MVYNTFGLLIHFFGQILSTMHRNQGEPQMSEVIFSVFPSENFVDLGLYQFGWEQ